MKRLLIAVWLLGSVFSFGQSHDSDSLYLLRIERQTREEDVCMLVRQDGHYHLERVIDYHPRVFEGELDAAALKDLAPLLGSQQLIDLRQSKIEMTLVGEDMDHVLLAVSRPDGWQSLNFPSGDSRNPHKAAVEPLLRWLDRNKQQQNPIVGMATTRCMLTPLERTAIKIKSNSPNPYVVRIIFDHYEPNADSLTDFKLTRLCTIVYKSGRYRLERSIQEFNAKVRPRVYTNTLDKRQMDTLRNLLDDPRLVALPNRAAPSRITIREGELTSLAIPRGNRLQSLNFAAFFGPHMQEQDIRDNLAMAVSADVELTHPIRKWVKQNIEDPKGSQVKDVPSTSCIPSTQPE
jgi:hypothetical protein